jgi:ribosomal protein L29
MAKQAQQQVRPSEMSADQLRKEMGDLKALQFQHRFEQSTGKLTNYRLITQTKRRLAAVLTAMRAQELAAGVTQRSSK